MSEMENPSRGDLTEDEFTRQQILKYGQDLARVYAAEKARREELEVAYQALSATFASTPDSLVVLDDTFHIQQANVAFGQLVELSLESMAGRLISDVLLSDQLLPALQRLAVDATAPTQMELTMTSPVKRALLANMARLQAGQIRGWVVGLQDQSNRKRLEYQKAEFINIAAHELRTPLSAVLGYGEFLRDSLSAELDRLGEEPLSYLDAMLRGANRLKNIIQELTEFAELSQGDMRSHGIQDFELLALIDEVMSDLQQAARDKRISLHIDRPGPSILMVADAALLRAALYQLVLNGINFGTPDGYVRIAATESAGQVFIAVCDSGMGIAQADLETIYRPFFQVESHATRHTGGLGLGLSIVQRAVAQLGGAITVDSILGQGTTFKLQLPLRQPSAESDILALREQLDSSYQQSLAYARDIQLLYRQAQQVNQDLLDTNARLEEANRLKAHLLSTLIHDLRSPFASVDRVLQEFSRHGVENLCQEQRDLLDQLTNHFGEAHRLIDSVADDADLLSQQGAG